MLSFYKKYYKTIFDIALIALTVYLIMWLFSIAYDIAAPIFWGLVIFWLIEPAARFMYRKGIAKPLAAAMAILFFILIILGVLTGLGAIFINQISTLSEKLPAYTENLQLQIVDTARYLQMKIGALPQDITSRAMEFATSLTEKGEQIAQWFLNSLLALLTSFSSFIVNLLIGVILAYFLSIEIDMWNQMAREKVPKTFKTAFAFLKENVIKGLLTYIKAQLKLISITFAIIYAALLLLGVSNAFAVALLAGIFDLLPLLGVSTLFIPWIIYLIFTGNIPLAVWLSILLAAVVVARQLLEPKITGDSLGVSAFTMLSFMIISLSLFGVTGLILSPILIILIKSLYEQGYLQKWIRRPEDY